MLNHMYHAYIYIYTYLCIYIYVYMFHYVYMWIIYVHVSFCTCMCICIQKVCDLLVDLNHNINEYVHGCMCVQMCVWAQACRQHFRDMLLNSLIVSCVHECWICFKTMEHACSNHNLILTLNVHAHRYTGAATCIITTSKMLQDMHIWELGWIYIYIIIYIWYIYIYTHMLKENNNRFLFHRPFSTWLNPFTILKVNKPYPHTLNLICMYMWDKQLV